MRRRAQLSTPHIGGRTAADPLAGGSSRRTPDQWFHPTLSLPKPIPGPTPHPTRAGHIIAGPTAPQTSNQTLLRKTSPSMHRTGEAPPLHRLRKRPPRRCIAHRGGTAIRLKQRPGTYIHMVICTYIRSPSVFAWFPRPLPAPCPFCLRSDRKFRPAQLLSRVQMAGLDMYIHRVVLNKPLVLVVPVLLIFLIAPARL